IIPGEGPCYRCVFPEPPPAGAVPTCQEAGVIGAIAGVMGVLQATEVIKLILGVGENLVGRLLTFDALESRFREVKIKRNPKCALCGENPTITELVEYELQC
ncbi:MAG: ThiF family adenylyltransferase, partial [Clostridia bacterium]|nr:ThiF family adenylyltransferase [Clostridia bacterium]